MAYELLILGTDYFGKMCLGVMALLVHDKIRSERKIDIHVVKQMRLEQMLGVAALILFTLSFTLSLV